MRLFKKKKMEEIKETKRYAIPWEPRAINEDIWGQGKKWKGYIFRDFIVSRDRDACPHLHETEEEALRCATEEAWDRNEFLDVDPDFKRKMGTD